MSLYENLKHLEFVTPFEGVELKRLAPWQRIYFNDVVRLVSQNNIRGGAIISYRGEGYAKLASSLRVSEELDGDVYQQIFYFGNKAKHYLEHKEIVSKRFCLTSVEDVSGETFEYIFNKIAVLAKHVYLRGFSFWRDNPALIQYFTNLKNRDDFCLKAQSLPFVERAKIRDYYLFLLHTAGRRGVSEESFLVSTSTDKSEAERFKDRDDPRRVIYYYYVPAPYEKYCVSSTIQFDSCLGIIELGLPRYVMGSGLYPRQREVAIRGGLLPHFMLGLERVDRGQFVVNPHILKMHRDKVQFVLEEGIKVEQEGFHDRIRETSYQRFSSLESDRFCGFEISDQSE